MTHIFKGINALLLKDFASAMAVFEVDPPDETVLYIACQTPKGAQTVLPYLRREHAEYFFSICSRNKNPEAMKVYQKFPDCLTTQNVSLYLSTGELGQVLSLEDFCQVAHKDTWRDIFTKALPNDDFLGIFCDGVRLHLLDRKWNDQATQQQAKNALLDEPIAFILSKSEEGRGILSEISKSGLQGALHTTQAQKRFKGKARL